MGVFGKSDGHFRAKIEIYPCGPTTRNRPAHNGIRWAFAYADDIEQLGDEKAPRSDVWPDFLDETGKSLSREIHLIGDYDAIMHIVASHMVDVHLQRVEVGTEFYCMEGTRRVAKGRVTQLSTL